VTTENTSVESDSFKPDPFDPDAFAPEAVECEQPKQRPMITFGPYATGSGRVEVCVWKNVHPGPNGDRTVYSVSFHRSYKDEANEWQKSQSLFTSDIPPLILGLNKAYEFILSRKLREKE
jgi:hypothetical protein